MNSVLFAGHDVWRECISRTHKQVDSAVWDDVNAALFDPVDGEVWFFKLGMIRYSLIAREDT